MQLHVQALVDVNHKAEVHITLLHTLHCLIDIVHVNHLHNSSSRTRPSTEHGDAGACYSIMHGPAGLAASKLYNTHNNMHNSAAAAC